ncbi:MAG TPA: PilZ domain-containing protein [Exilispira sp.]|nr:PilZ domain-containing protein [Exilispira sp.]
MLQEEILTIRKSVTVGTSNKTSGTGIFIALLLIAVLVFLFLYFNRKGYFNRFLKTKSKEHKMFEEAALVRGIPKNDIEAILNVLDFVPIKSPVLLFASKQNFETFLIKAISILKGRDKSSNNFDLTITKNRLYFLLSNLDNYFKDMKKSVSSKDLNVGKRVRIYINDLGYFFTEVIASLDRGFVVKKPKIEKEPKSWKMPVTVYFWRENDAGYSFETYIEDEVNETTIKGLLIRHSDILLRYQKRKYLRKECRFYSTYSLVEIQEDSSGKKTMKVVPPEYDGTVFDIGGGGFAIEVNNKIGLKKYIKISIFIGRQNIKAIAEIVRYEKVGQKYYMHGRFVKISPADQNIIYEFVYSKLIK